MMCQLFWWIKAAKGKTELWKYLLHYDQNHSLIVGFELQLEISGFGAVLILELPSTTVIIC